METKASRLIAGQFRAPVQWTPPDEIRDELDEIVRHNLTAHGKARLNERKVHIWLRTEFPGTVVSREALGLYMRRRSDELTP
jgi:hypothetical protein